MRLIKIPLLGLCVWLYAMVAQAASLPDFKELVKESSPAVVNISTIQGAKPNQASRRPFSDRDLEDVPEIFRHFFRFPDGGQGPGRQGPRKAPQSLGSGFIISSDGFILTNNHVVDGAEKVIVRLSDRRELSAEVIGTDKRTDMAVLKIDANNLPTVELGDSSKLEVGEWVLAIGSPFGFDHTVTAGIVSAKERALANETYVPFIQTDVAINPGNSGGPLFNLDGEVVGINSQIYTRSGGFMGLSFAIPINVAMEVAEQLKDKGYVSRGWLGVIIQEVNKDLAESFGLDRPAGALVARVLPDSPAADGGLMEGDVITKFNGRNIILSSDLPHVVGRVMPGKTARVEVVRGGKEKVIKLKIGELPDNLQANQNAPSVKKELASNRLNVVVSELDEESKSKWNLYSGVVIQRVDKGPAADAGLMAGDVVTMLNGVRIDSVKSFQRAASQLPANKVVPVRVVRRGSPQFIALKIGK